MTLHRHPFARRILPACLLTFAALAVVLPSAHRADAADDIDLLRENGGNPYVMVLLDTSASMSLTPPTTTQNKDIGDLLPANGDDPSSKLFQVKQALYEVFSNVENVNYGFATFNMDEVRVQAKHWLYAPLADGSFTGAGNLTFPQAPNAGSDNILSDREKLDSYWVLGHHYDGGEAGTCSAPIDYSSNNGHIALARFPKLGVTGQQSTVLWVALNNKTYRVQVSRSSVTSLTFPPDSTETVLNGQLGDATIVIDIVLQRVDTCSPLLLQGTPDRMTIPFERVTQFLMVEGNTDGGGGNPTDAGIPGVDNVGMSNNNNAADTCKNNVNESIAGFWDFQDIIAEGTCGGDDENAGPFTGRGWEGNADSAARAGQPNVDRYCTPGGSCYNLRFPTVTHPDFDETPGDDIASELDYGDFIPLNWETDYREEFLKRLNPRHPNYDPENAEEYFGIATFFEDTPDSTGILKLKNEDERPIMAFGSSPLARALNDFRCWYLGPTSSGAGKCRQSDNGDSFNPGWESLFLEHDVAYQCRIPYLIIITDGEETSAQGENSTADISDFDGLSGIKNYVFTFQETPAINSLFKTGAEGELILVRNKDELKTRLEEVIGTITQATRTFATAAVPSVQTAVQNQIYLTKFQPLNDAGVWEGHLHAFRRPMPSGQTDPPNRDYPNWVWDAALAMLDQSSQPASDGDNSSVDLQIGPGVNERRVLFARERIPGDSTVGGFPLVHELFNRTTAGSNAGTPSAVEEDLWAGLELPYDSSDPNSVRDARDRANEIIEETLLQKQSNITSDTDDLDWYLMGEIFHSNPLIVGGPVNTQYFIEDAEETYEDDGTQKGTGYREFFNKHENRRKVVVAGANDGMLHAFDAGRASVNDSADPPAVEFNVGTGKEIFSFIPRSVLPTVKHQAENPETHRWSVDGSPVAADVFIDPVHSGTPVASDREWRTVVIGGLREGGTSYYALDITHPDPLEMDTVGPNTEPVAQRDVYVPNDDSKVVPPCYSATGDGDLGCDDEVKYPAALWEFTDRIWDDVAKEWVALDEDDVDGDGTADGNHFVDLAETWSTPNVGRIRVEEDGEIVNKYVAIFGGGLDPAKAGSRGNWLYIVDVETGKALYKRQLEGSAPSEPAAIDSDQDGFYDRIYIGTTSGNLYRVDLVAVDSNGNMVYPEMTDQIVCGINGVCNYSVTRIEKGSDASDPLWAPREILDAGNRPIYFPPAVLFVADLGEYALALGTGDRDDLTSKTGDTGRFYVFVDESAQLSDTDLPMTDTNFEQIDRNEGSNGDLLTDSDIPVGEKGWFLVLNDKERLIGDAFGFSGVTFFATFEPAVTASCSVSCAKDATDCTECDKPDNDGELEPNETPQCTLGGTSRIYVVGTTNADAFLEDVNGVLTRSFDIEGQFVTSPFTEQAVTTTTNVDTDGDGVPDEEVEANPLNEAEKKLMQKLIELFPDQCKFGNHRIDINVVQANSEIKRIATVPICVIEKNWREVSP